MAITDEGGIVRAFLSAREVSINKGNLASQLTGGATSLWRATGYPAQGAIPTTAAICDSTTVGAMPLPGRAGDEDRVILGADLVSSLASNCYMFEDRLAHMGGLSGILTTAQAVGVDITGTGSNLVERRGSSDYGDVRWWLEWYVATGSTAVNAVVGVTYDDGSTGTITVAVTASTGASRRIEIVPVNGRWVRSVETVTLSATTGTAGNFGVTATRTLGRVTPQIANRNESADWVNLRARRVADQACLTMGVATANATSGALGGALYIGVE